jgi:hypothetical protein
MNRNSIQENGEQDRDLNEFESVSHTNLQGLDNEEAKTPSHQSHAEPKPAMYISLSSIQAEAAMRHMPSTFILVEKNKLK